jgi:hypothetical protein
MGQRVTKIAADVGKRHSNYGSVVSKQETSNCRLKKGISIATFNMPSNLQWQ